ncbi:Lrp/AsnC family transcriptional regulator [Methermicoccus shengliensis]|uniref:Lrp/AsnC family transcriptional regulator n=1 Tax=Methermicoccus shengliensis TaxID=660064 RepID=UPI0005B2D048|nr:Lrp/AsnC family transcriptional regulator [Methermicoccus shengliensis]
MDSKDRKILSRLMENARVPKTKIAESLGVSETAVRKRITNLEREGVILGYRVMVNYKRANMFASITGIDVGPEHLWNIINALRGMDEVKTIMLTSGDHTIMTEIVAHSLDELSELHTEISRMEGVKRICPAIVLETIK